VTLKCSFCEETCPSSDKLREHLLLCGNKTDQCPNCHQRIRRSHFAYHYENNCAPIDRVETPRPKRRAPLCLVTDSNRPQLTPISSPSNQNQDEKNSNGIVHLPCEICNEPIDLPNWSQHTVSRFHILNFIL
jgi:hypothetical protein